MSILKTLKLTAATSNAPLTPEQMLRGKLVSYLNEQKALAEAEISGTSFVATKKVTRKNAEGENIRVDAPQRSNSVPGKAPAQLSSRFRPNCRSLLVRPADRRCQRGDQRDHRWHLSQDRTNPQEIHRQHSP